MKHLAWIGVAILLVAAVLGTWLAPGLFMACWLAAWWWCLGLVLGCFTNAWLSVLTGGAWGLPMRGAAVLLGTRLPWLLVGLLPLALGPGELYAWAADPHWADALARPAFAQAWLSPSLFRVRLALYALGWWWLARPATLTSKGRAAAALALHTVMTSLAAFDLLMSLQPGWYSTAFGLVALAAQALAGCAFAVLLAARTPAAWPQRGTVPLWRDLGNLLLMWTMTWAYLAFMQLLVIWAENLPREISWYLPRLQTGWALAGMALVLLQLALPCVALLFRALKDNPRWLGAIAALLLATSVLDAAWTVLPSVDAHSLHAWWLLPLTVAGLALPAFAPLWPAAPPLEAAHAVA